ncbi:MAG: hypothetical protein FVQ83_00350 [Chloroflexi bacterium]|nr:hypothetical protein [Chloroflexota bacterium]
MTFSNTLIPLASSIISFIFAVLIFKRYFDRKSLHLLLWGLGMVFYGIGGFSEAYYGAFGWNALIFRMWYLFGAILVAAWLGQGTVYLLAKRRKANVLMIILVIGSLFGLFMVFNAELDSSPLATSGETRIELSGKNVIPRNVRLLTPFFNIYGTLTLIGGAIYSAWIFYRKRILLHRTVGNILIATGAILPAMGGIFSRFEIPGILYILEFFGAILIFTGFLRATSPMDADQPATEIPSVN